MNVFFYVEDGNSPSINWLIEQPRKVIEKFGTLLRLLEAEGAALKRPHSAPLRDGIHELRVRHLHVNYRLLYFFDGKSIAIVSHGCTKEAAVEEADIDRALVRKRRYEADSENHRLA